ncbi:hypothetical protein [Pseudoduganella violaceinigra]|uniref:hypothetical protein n=1 Tax=Pseudoduganella violaceinigra TaxID=246602 RepID=UPI00041B9324|nr:hypothetical protein [Pseudoduganella violaceinigra]
MQHEAIQRQVALVSYGSKFLGKQTALDDWYRHGVFWDARFQFRAPETKALLADDFTLWLEILARAGALRLSLHSAGENGSNVVMVHYPDRYQTWSVVEERAEWRDHPSLSGDDRHWYIPRASDYAGNVDCYWCMGETPGAFAVPHTDWKALAGAIGADLDIAVPSSLVPAGSCYVEPRGSEAWAKMPLFVAPPLAHHILSTLYREQAKFANDTHCKNENSHYHRLGAEEAAAMDHWGERLNSWIGEVHMRAANDCRGAAVANGSSPFQRLQAPPPPRQPVEGAEPTAPPVETRSPTKVKWTNRVATAIACAALSLLVLACAHLIARYPSLAILIGLPLVLSKRS